MNAVYREYAKAHGISWVTRVANINLTFFNEKLSNVSNEIIPVLVSSIVAVAKVFALQTQTQ